MNASSDGDPRKTVRVTIAGEDYTIRTEADEDYTLRCAALVDQRMKAIAGEGTAGAAQTRAAIMAALSISDDLFQQKVRTRERAMELAKRVEEALQEGAASGSRDAGDDMVAVGSDDSASDGSASDGSATSDFAAGDFAASDLAPADAPPED